jgi:predicted enzyme related to lactoylglutathione lyase
MARSITPDIAIRPRVDGPVPMSRSVPSLAAALSVILRDGGSITSETRTAPGIGSWTFVADGHGNEIVLWEDAVPA